MANGRLFTYYSNTVTWTIMHINMLQTTTGVICFSCSYIWSIIKLLANSLFLPLVDESFNKKIASHLLKTCRLLDRAVSSTQPYIGFGNIVWCVAHQYCSGTITELHTVASFLGASHSQSLTRDFTFTHTTGPHCGPWLQTPMRFIILWCSSLALN